MAGYSPVVRMGERPGLGNTGIGCRMIVVLQCLQMDFDDFAQF